jgi:hypothetical protein
MTQAQLGLYRREWNLARKWFRAHGLDPVQADAKRHAIHRQALGADKSSLDLTNPEFDKVLAAFRGVYDGGNLDAQLRQVEQPELRTEALRAGARELATGCVSRGGSERAYLDGLARRVFKALGFDDLTERQLQQLCGILARRKKHLRVAAAVAGSDDPF